MALTIHGVMPTSTARVTLEDVRQAVGDSDPNQTNAAKVRAALGNRGSFETIQKHLATLRAELATASAPPVAGDAVPTAPVDAVNQIWVAAWTAAQVQTMARTERLAAERDAALVMIEAQDQDLSGLSLTLDTLTVQLDDSTAARVAIEDQAKADTVTHAEAFAAAQLEAKAQTDALAADLARTQAELEKSHADAAHAAEITASSRSLMREELAHLVDQITELKAALYKRPDAAPTPAQ